MTYDTWRTTPPERPHEAVLTDECDCECGHVGKCGNQSCLPADSDPQLRYDRFVCVGGELRMLYDRREP